MSDDVWKRDEIQSPCVKICVIHPEARNCIGCHRTGDEIAGWMRKTPEERQAIMDALPKRKALLPGRRGGRSGRSRYRST
ncbi:MAG: DUF1289 domain-containing protein [Boseongicola sp.]|nr:MAG: DUF1289 domain-containing protein [Boseongicola sp.]